MASDKPETLKVYLYTHKVSTEVKKTLLVKKYLSSSTNCSENIGIMLISLERHQLQTSDVILTVITKVLHGFSVIPGKCQYNTLKWGHDYFLKILSKLQ
jgi:uncharacterized protein YybS (DUF2232 family)